ncbi:hypothetical protein HHK36_006684 [Tetracentron sinense]|uniref:NADP-dependent oxidoreductase domain-containing protein n=1 Tax=Tetracentron sinense TaxID=13715 RepID=A0A834ZKZ1_TETSI|nr:hypothetical protein HHK36_006684 [Tetracentron sinense]
MGENIPSVVLSSGWKMPIVALGTATPPLPPPQVLTSAYLDAIKVGYRHFDTAALYRTEEPLGNAVAEALRRGLIGIREDLFITSKLWKLGLEYVDLYHVHWQVRLKKGEMVFPYNSEDLLPFDMRGTWEAMEECCRLGLAKSIGVSNFTCKKLSQLLDHATIPPAVNQVELNTAWQQRKLMDFYKEKGIHVSAWSPVKILMPFTFLLIRVFTFCRMMPSVSSVVNLSVHKIPRKRSSKTRIKFCSGGLIISSVGCVPKMGENVPSVVLSSGWKMPMVALGTAAHPLPPPQVLISAYLDAIEVGYRHFDTAALYHTEEPLGQAVAEALRRGLIGARDDLFITSKLWKLGLEYVDLYLVHWPVRLKKVEMAFSIRSEDVLPFDMRGTWEAMEECCRLGLTKSIGVSNFSCKKLSQLLAHSTIPAAVNQVELNPAWQQRKLIDFCKEKGIHVALRWIYEQGASVVVKSFNKGRMKENLQIFGDWELSEEDLNKISQIPQQRGFPGEELFVSANGPYKSLDELWDGEI